MSGAGGKAFCAGGDVQMIREALSNETLSTCGCCQVSLCDGITMGGGVGLSTHGPFRIVTEKTRFAMPEMAIGLFPDVGATYLLSRLKAGGNVGRFMAMTGTTLAAWDALRAGVGTHFVPSSRTLGKNLDTLCRFKAKLIGEDALRLCEDTIREVAASAEPSGGPKTAIVCVLVSTARCFSAPSVEEIIARLKTDGSDFAVVTLQKMFQSCSPTSCKVALRAMHEAAQMSIGPVLQMEYRLSQRFTTRPQPLSDFFDPWSQDVV
ncbi:3-hydroxyisobutyryl-CoA hydrolase [Durusdinium trenchii]|uniref:3-hydroxyisobutyryl-CoA hydrolase n=1 Tax=Durusdinium trenchii TaxID=1381693 RepID=A0ABP0MDN0_9DINO